MTSSTAGSVSSGRPARSHHHRRHHHHWHGGGAPPPGSVYSEHETDNIPDTAVRIGARSQSLSALQPAVIQPRMARLETLEAKMASIEVSLSSGSGGGGLGRRRKTTAASPSPRTHTQSNKENHSSASTPTGRQGHARSRPTTGSTMVNHRQQSTVVTTPVNNSSVPTSKEDRDRDERLKRIKAEADGKRLAIKNIRLALDRLDITDNIDVRIRQAELEYQLGREELNLLTLTEEARRLQLQHEEELEHGNGKRSSEHNSLGSGGTHLGDHTTLHSLLKSGGGRAELVAVEAPWDRGGGPRFGVAGNGGSNGGNGNGGGCSWGMLVEWAAEGSAVKRGDRLVEVNGKLVTAAGSWSREDLARALATRPSPAQIVVLRNFQGEVSLSSTTTNSTVTPASAVLEVAALRQELGAVRAGADEARKAKDGLRADNLRLTHRISYLEEQVQELLMDRDRQHSRHERRRSAVEREMAPSPCVTSVIDLGSGEVVQVYQKGPRSITGTCSRSVRSLDLDADYASEPTCPARGRRPQPPKKPLRLSLHRRAQSLQSVDGGGGTSSPLPAAPPPVAQRQSPPSARQSPPSAVNGPQQQQPPSATTTQQGQQNAVPQQETANAAPRKRTHRGEYPQGAIRWSTGGGASRTRPQGNKWC